jgi:acetyl esterase/lipase
MPVWMYGQDYRYVRSIFPASVRTAAIVYGSAPALNSPFTNESATTVQNLLLDLYEPQGDVLQARPAIVFAHGGGFVTGSRTVDDMSAFCDSFARKGYVCVTIDYRQGVEVVDNGNLHYTRAAYRGLQDGRSAVRFLRANAAAYRIDPGRIYWGGNSAGSFIGLNSIYMDSDEKPAQAGAVNYTVGFFPFTGPDLGALDAGGNTGFSGRPDAVMACWGGVGDTLTIGPDNPAPVFLVHGTADAIVPFNSGPPFGLPGIAAVYGSNAIQSRLTHLGMPAQHTLFVTGVGHEFYGVTNGNWTNGTGGNAWWDSVMVQAARFFWLQHKPISEFTWKTFGLTAAFTDASTGALSWRWDFGDGFSGTAQSPDHTFPAQGTYTVRLYVENGLQSWDTVSRRVEVSPATGWSRPERPEIKVYPDPTTGWVTVDFGLPLEKVRLQVCDLSGRMVAEKFNQRGSCISLDLSGLKNGIYVIGIISDRYTRHVRVVKY